MDTDDLLDLLESDEKPFSNDSQPKEESKPYQKDGYKKQYTKNTNKVDLWNDTDIEPTKLDRSEFKPLGKYFSINFFKGEDEIPPEVAENFYKAAKVLMGKGFMLRYNGDNADFINKVLDIDLARVEMYVPWKKFNTTFTPKMVRANEKAYHVAAYYHKKFKDLPNPVRAILARDVHVLFGENVDNPVKLVLCYSPDGAENMKSINYKTTGSISFTVSLCEAMGIPVFNLKNDDAISRLVEYIKTM